MKKIELLQTVSIFWDLKSKELGYIAEKMVARHYDNGNYIFLEDSDGEQCFFVLEGSVKVTRLSKDGREVILAMLNEGDFFGEMSLLDGESRSANVIALEKTEVLTLDRRDFLDVVNDYPQIAVMLLKELAGRLRKSDRQIASLSLSDSEHRIAITLIRFAQELGTIKKGEVTIRNLPFQQDIANMAGTSRETVSRTIKLLEEKKLVKKDKKDLIIYNFDEFRQLFS